MVVFANTLRCVVARDWLWRRQDMLVRATKEAVRCHLFAWVDPSNDLADTVSALSRSDIVQGQANSATAIHSLRNTSHEPRTLGVIGSLQHAPFHQHVLG